jgi:hypothetical protein
MSEKIKPHHLERGAYVYVRQSTPYQVRNHLESKERQYALTERAKQLGFGKLIVIDDDLGRSGSGMQERPGFGKLLTSVCQGLAGAVFALEASRLARNNRDWHHLVDLCTLTETLLDRHRGGGHPPTPATPPCVRVRTRRFETVTLALIDQGRKTERFEVRIRKPHSESLGSGERPRATPAAGRVAGQARENPEL